MSVKTIALDGLSSNPPALHHQLIARQLASEFHETIVAPCGLRPDKLSTNDIPAIHRAVMTDMTFQGIERVTIDLSDLERGEFTRTYDLYQRYKNQGDVWIVVGTDLITGGRNGNSQIQQNWFRGNELWRTAKFAVTVREGYELNEHDLPHQHRIIRPTVVEARHFSGSSTQVREKTFRHESIHELVVPRVREYIARYGLYHGMLPQSASPFLELKERRCFVVYDRFNNSQAEKLAKMFEPFSATPHDADFILVIGGDGTMLRTIREYWRERKPFIGINAGHVGFMLNDMNESGFTSGLFFAERMRIRHAPLLYVEGTSPSGKKVQALAFEDCFTRAVKGGQAVWSKLVIDGEVKIPRLVSDGVLVSTPAGSTAYARSMGASPVRMETDVMLVVGNNVFMPAWKSAYISDQSIVSVYVLEHERRPVEAFVDGVSIGQIVELTIRKSNIAAAELGFTRKHDIDRKLSKLQFPD